MSNMFHLLFIRPINVRFSFLSFHSRNSEVLNLAFCVFVRPLLKSASQVWSSHYKYFIDKVESVQRFFTRTISGIKDLPYSEHLKNLGLETLERRRLTHDLCDAVGISSD